MAFNIQGGQFLLGDGTPVANGTVVLTLSVAATVISTGLAAASSYTFNLDANGVIIGQANVNGNAELTPTGTSYSTVAKNSGGTTVWGPLTWIVGPSAAYAGTLFPGVMALPLITGVVMGASGTTHAQGATPDTPVAAGTTKFLREDATWAAPTGGSGTVTSVAATVPAFLTIAGTPITVSGTLAFDLATQAANLIFAGPSSGGAVKPTFRALADADLLKPMTLTPGADAVAVLAVKNSAATTTVLAVDTTGGGNGVNCAAPAGGGFSLNASGTAHLAVLWLVNTMTRYQDVATVAAGIPAIYAQSNLTAQSAAIAATNLKASTDFAGLYRISWAAKVTTAATTSSVLGGTNGFQVVYTDNDDSVVVTPLAEPVAAATGNTTQTQLSGSVYVQAKLATALQYKFDYTSVGGTAMQFAIHVRVEFLG